MLLSGLNPGVAKFTFYVLVRFKAKSKLTGQELRVDFSSVKCRPCELNKPDWTEKISEDSLVSKPFSSISSSVGAILFGLTC